MQLRRMPTGTLCQKCQAKFYTERSVFAEFCPACKASEIQQVVCFVCDKDGQTAVLPRTKGAIPCVKCQAPMASIRLVREADLQPWGAVKKARAEVSRH